MIKSRDDLKRYLNTDMEFYHKYSTKDKWILKLVQDPSYKIKKYIDYLRHEEYYFNARTDIVGRFLYYYYLRKKNKLGNELGFKIPKNCFQEGLTIYHHGNVIVNEKARVGKACKLHGNNCIGNNGVIDEAPAIGDGLDLGVGASVIGGVTLADNIVVGANAVVVKDVNKKAATLVGIPARLIER